MSVGVHDVAGIDQAHAGHAVDGRRDARVVEVQVGGVDLRLVGLHLRLELRDRRRLVGVLLRGDELLVAAASCSDPR